MPRYRLVVPLLSALAAASASAQLTVNLDGNGSGAVSVFVGPVLVKTCTQSNCRPHLPPGARSVDLLAAPAPMSAVTGWAGTGCAGLHCTVASSATVTVTFSRNVPLTVTSRGPGVLRSDPPGIFCGPTCRATFPPGSAVTLIADATPGALITWNGACGSGGDRTCALTLNGATQTGTTFFFPTVTVNFAGNGHGYVESASPAERAADASLLRCDSQNGRTCGPTHFPARTPVTLHAIPIGGTFLGWSGACQGTDDCTLPMTASATVTASFQDAPPVASSGGTPRAPTVVTGSTGQQGQTRPSGQQAGIDCNCTVTGGYVSPALPAQADPTGRVPLTVNQTAGGGAQLALGGSCNLLLDANPGDATWGFSPHGRYFTILDLDRGTSRLRVYPLYPRCSYTYGTPGAHVSAFGFGPDAHDRAMVVLDQATTARTDIYLVNLDSNSNLAVPVERVTITSPAEGGISLVHFSPCGELLGVKSVNSFSRLLFTWDSTLTMKYAASRPLDLTGGVRDGNFFATNSAHVLNVVGMPGGNTVDSVLPNRSTAVCH